MSKKRLKKARKLQSRGAQTHVASPAVPDQLPKRGSNVWWWLLLALVGVIHVSYGPGYHRELIRLDDWQYVSPLESLSLYDYLTTWMWLPDKLAYPMRDITYLFDFWVSTTTGYRSFVVTSVGIFLLYLAVLRQVLRFYLPERLVLPCLAIVALHPLSVEVLHWVISRKHLLVGLFVSMYVWQIESIRQKSKNPTRRFWLATGAYALSLLSHPTGVFLPLFSCVRLRRNVPRAGLAVHIITAGGFAVLWLGLSSFNNRDYGGLFSKEGIDAGSIEHMVSYGVMAIGRGFYQLILPLSQAIYRDPYDKEHLVGLGLLVAWSGLVWSQWARLRANRERLFEGGALASLALILFLPQFLFVVRRTEFAMADRFLFLSLPFFVALTSWCVSSWISAKNEAIRSVLFGLFGVYLVLLAVQTRRILPLWDSAEEVFRHCIARTDSSQCWWHLSDDLFRRGCQDLMKDEQAFTSKLASLRGTEPGLFTNEGYFRLAVCVGTATSAGPEIKDQFLGRYAQNGARPESLTFARSLIALERGDSREALNQVMAVYGGGSADTKAFTLMMLGMEQGVLNGICAKGVGDDLPCVSALAEFTHRYSGNPVESRFIDFGRQAAIEAWGRRGVKN